MTLIETMIYKKSIDDFIHHYWRITPPQFKKVELCVIFYQYFKRQYENK